MTNTYKPVSERAKALYGDDAVELDLSAGDEGDHLHGGHLELVPRKYKALVNNFNYDGKALEQGEEFDGALLVDVENALVSGGVIERVEPKKKATAKKAADKPKSDDG